MPILAQFLAALANEIRRGKTLVDIETARQSTLFLQDDFLRLLPITRIDVDQVRLRFKMAVAEIVVTTNDSPFLTALTGQLTDRIMKARDRLRVTEKLSAQILSPVIAEAAVLALIPELSDLAPSRIAAIRDLLANRFAKNFVERFVKLTTRSTATVRRQVSTMAQEVFTTNFDKYFETYKEDLGAQMLKEFGRLDVVVEGQKLKEFPPDVLVELELHLIPKTYHWSLKPEFVDKPEAPPEKKYTLMPGG